jgi:hypothetical protein
LWTCSAVDLLLPRIFAVTGDLAVPVRRRQSTEESLACHGRRDRRLVLLVVQRLLGLDSLDLGRRRLCTSPARRRDRDGLPAFAVVRDGFLTVPGGPLVSIAVAANVMGGITGSASAKKARCCRGSLGANPWGWGHEVRFH